MFRTGRPLPWSFLLTVALAVLAGAGLRGAPVQKPATPQPGPGFIPPALLHLKGHAKGIFNVVFSLDGKLLATSSQDNTLKVWDALTGAEKLHLKGHRAAVYSAAFSPDGKLLASASADNTVKLWDVATGKETRTLSGHTQSVFHVSFSPDGKRLASGSDDRTVRIWESATGKLLHTLEGHTQRVLTVAFHPDGQRLASCSTSNGPDLNASGGEVKIWDVIAGEELLALPAGNQNVTTVTFSPDGRRLAGANLARTIKVWEVATGQDSLVLRGHTQDVYHVTFSPDGRRLASCSGRWNQDQGGEIKVWDLPAGQAILSFKGHAATNWSLAFSPDGRRLASASGKWNKEEPGEVKVWDLAAVHSVHAPPPGWNLEGLWADLAGADAARAYQAVWALSDAPGQALPFLRDHCRPGTGPRVEDELPRLITDLDSDRFEIREKATETLEKLGRIAHPALRKALTSPSAEVRRRAEQILELKSSPRPLAGEGLRTLRAIEVLQRIGTAEVRPVLERLAGGSACDPASREAAIALDCLARRPAP